MSAPDPSRSAALAAAALPSAGSGRATPPSRPEPADQLLAAVRGRDALRAAGLLQQWVHRRGVASLTPFRLRLAAAEGEEACLWLQALIDDPSGAASMAVPPPPPEPEALGRISSAVDQAVAAYWQETSPAPLSDPPSPAIPPQAPVEPPLQTMPAPAEELSAFPGLGLGLGRRVAAAGRQSLIGLRGLVRDCLDEAIGGFGAASAAPIPPAAGTRPPAVAATSAATAGAATSAAVTAGPALDGSSGALPPSSAAAPQPWGSRTAAGSSRQLRSGFGSRPAPAPAALADLRAWLPDSGDQGSPAR